MQKNASGIPCPLCGNPLTISKATADKTQHKPGTKRSTIHCPHCDLSVKEALQKKFNSLGRNVDETE